MKVLNKCSHLPPTKNTKLMFGFLLFPVHWRCIYWRDGGQGAAPGQQQAEVASQRIWYRHPHQPHPLQQPMELHVPASSTAQVCSTWFLRGSVHLQNFMAIHPVAVVCILHKNRVKLIFNITEQAVYLFSTLCLQSNPLTKQPAQALWLILIFWFLPAGGWTPPAIVQMQCVLLHLSRKENKSGTAPPSVAAGWSKREPKRALVTEHAAAQVPGTERAEGMTGNNNPEYDRVSGEIAETDINWSKNKIHMKIIRIKD